MASTGYQKYDSFIIDGDIDTRMRLRTATSAVPQFGKIQALSELREGLSKLETADNCDVIFLSSKFPDAEIKNFIASAKGTRRGQDSAFVLVLNANNQNSGTVANNVLIGVDGFLFEPYSVDQLVEITHLAAKVKKERSDARERVALTLLIQDIINQIDLVSYLKTMKMEPGTSLRKLRELCEALKSLNPESFKLYSELAVKLFVDAPLPKKMFRTEQYKGASSRIKRKNTEKIVTEAEASMAKAKAETTDSGK